MIFKVPANPNLTFYDKPVPWGYVFLDVCAGSKYELLVKAAS